MRNIFCFSVPTLRFYVRNNLICKIHNFYPYVFLQCPNNSLTHLGNNLTDCLFRNLENILLTDVRVACGQKSHCYRQSLFNRNSCLNLISLFTIFGLTKFISSSKSAVAIRINFLYRPLNSRHFKSAHQLVPLHTDLFLYNSVCHQHLSRRFLLLDNM